MPPTNNKLTGEIQIITKSAQQNLSFLNRQLENVSKSLALFKSNNIREMGVDMQRLGERSSKVFSISDAIADSLKTRGLDKQWTYMNEAVGRTTKKLQQSNIASKMHVEATGSITDAIQHSNLTRKGNINALEILNSSTKKATKSISFEKWVTDKATKSKKNHAKASLMQTKSFMGLGFSLLFGGMAIKKTFSAALKSLFNNYRDVMGETSAFNQLTNQLSGSWTFFKFTLMDALMQTGLFERLISFTVNLVNSISQIFAEKPKLAQIIVIFSAIMVVLGTIAMVAGQVGLAFIGWKMAAIPSIKIISVRLLKTFGIIGIIITAILLLTKISNSDIPKVSKLFLGLGVVLLSIAGILAILGFSFAAVWVAVIGGIAIVVGAFFMFRDTIKSVWDLLVNWLASKWTKWSLRLIDDLLNIVNAFNNSGLTKIFGKINTKGLDEVQTKLQTIGFMLDNERVNLKHELKTNFDNELQTVKDLVGYDDIKEKIGSFTSPKIDDISSGNDYEKELKDLQNDQNNLTQEQILTSKENITATYSVKDSIDILNENFGIIGYNQSSSTQR